MDQIREVIVVEGKDDQTAVKAAVSAQVICTGGYCLSKKTIQHIQNAAARCGVIILTDPDYMGEQIRRRVSEKVPGAKHAFIPREAARLGEDIGVENATPEAIREALAHVRTLKENVTPLFTLSQLVQLDLCHSETARMRRARLGKILGIGYGNAKQFLNRLNAFDISQEEVDAALGRLNAIEDSEEITHGS